MRACPNGHPIDDDRARICPACGSLLVPLEAAAARAARAEVAGATRTDVAGTAGGSGSDPAPARRERISAPVLGLALAAIAVAIGLFAAWMALQQPRSGPTLSPSPAPEGYDSGWSATAGWARDGRQPDGGPSSPVTEMSWTSPRSLTE
jgi:hypothetical protein